MYACPFPFLPFSSFPFSFFLSSCVLFLHFPLQRLQTGLKPLDIDWKLVELVRRHASWMAANHALKHTSDAVVEKIAMGQSNTASAVAA